MTAEHRLRFCHLGYILQPGTQLQRLPLCQNTMCSSHPQTSVPSMPWQTYSPYAARDAHFEYISHAVCDVHFRNKHLPGTESSDWPQSVSRKATTGHTSRRLFTRRRASVDLPTPLLPTTATAGQPPCCTACTTSSAACIDTHACFSLQLILNSNQVTPKHV